MFDKLEMFESWWHVNVRISAWNGCTALQEYIPSLYNIRFAIHCNSQFNSVSRSKRWILHCVPFPSLHCVLFFKWHGPIKCKLCMCCNVRSSVGDSANGASLKEENCKMMHLQSIYDYIILAYDDVGVDVMKLCHAHVTIPFICHSEQKVLQSKTQNTSTNYPCPMCKGA